MSYKVIVQIECDGEVEAFGETVLAERDTLLEAELFMRGIANNGKGIS